MIVDKVKTDRVEVWKAEIIKREYVKEILGKIKDEIILMPTLSFNANDIYKADVLAIIDKYIEGSESE